MMRELSAVTMNVSKEVAGEGAMFWSTVTKLQRGDSVTLAKEREKAKAKLEKQLAAAVKENLVNCTRCISKGQLLAKTDPAYQVAAFCILPFACRLCAGHVVLNMVMFVVVLQDRHKDAEMCCLKALKDQPENSKAHAMLGLCKYFLSFYKGGELEPPTQLEVKAILLEALAHLKTSLNIDSTSPTAADCHVFHGDILSALGRFEEAEAAFDKSIAISPLGADAYRRKVTLLFEQGHCVRGFEVLAKALELDPTYRPPRAVPPGVNPERPSYPAASRSVKGGSSLRYP